MKTTGRLIVFEGLDHSGKSTCVEFIKKQVKFFFPKQEVVFTYQPYDKLIRPELLSLLKNNHLHGTDLFYLLIDRHLHLQKIVFPGLAAGKIVICDRFYYSSFVYQSLSLRKPFEEIEQIHRLLDIFPRPDLVFFINPPLLTVKTRLNNKENHLIVKENLTELQRRYETVFAHYRAQNHPIIEISDTDLHTYEAKIWTIFRRQIEKWNENLKN